MYFGRLCAASEAGHAGCIRPSLPIVSRGSKRVRSKRLRQDAHAAPSERPYPSSGRPSFAVGQSTRSHVHAQPRAATSSHVHAAKCTRSQMHGRRRSTAQPSVTVHFTPAPPTRFAEISRARPLQWVRKSAPTEERPLQWWFANTTPPLTTTPVVVSGPLASPATTRVVVRGPTPSRRDHSVVLFTPPPADDHSSRCYWCVPPSAPPSGHFRSLSPVSDLSRGHRWCLQNPLALERGPNKFPTAAILQKRGPRPKVPAPRSLANVTAAQPTPSPKRDRRLTLVARALGTRVTRVNPACLRRTTPQRR